MDISVKNYRSCVIGGRITTQRRYAILGNTSKRSGNIGVYISTAFIYHQWTPTACARCWSHISHQI